MPSRPPSSHWPIGGSHAPLPFTAAAPHLPTSSLISLAPSLHTGFHRVANTGSVQLALTARLLERAGFAFWDLGQEFEYKLKLGARLWPRVQFLERFHAVRGEASRLAEVAQVRGPRFQLR